MYKPRMTIGVLAAAVASTALSSVDAQTRPAGDDVVVMRRVLAPPNRPAMPAPSPSPSPSPSPAPAPAPAPAPSPSPAPSPAPVPTAGNWSYGDWVYLNGDTCTTSAPQRRTAACIADGVEVPSARCGPQDVLTRSVERLEGCTRSWHQDASAWSSECSTTATRTDVWTCRRSDGTTVPDGECSATAAKPVPVTMGAQYGTCTYRWATTEYAWSSQCSDAAVQTRTVTCQRRPAAEGGDATVIADVQDRTLCASDGPEPAAATDPVRNISQCSYDWVYGTYGWNGVANAYSSTCSRQAEQTRAATCWRHTNSSQSTSGKVVTGAEALCTPNPAVTGRTAAIYSSCVNAIANGGFESGSMSPWTGGHSVFCGSPGYGANNSSCVARIAQDATMSLALSGLDAGSSYTLAVYAASASNTRNEETLRVTMTSSSGNVQTASRKFAANGGNPSGSNGWSTVFVATSSSMTLGITPTAGGIAKVDDISLNIVPQ